jgi:hypothetical protein
MANAIVKERLVHGPATTIEVGGVDIGPTSQNGVQVKVTPEYYKDFVDQKKTPVKVTLMAREYEVDFELRDLKMSNLLIAFGLPAANGSGCCGLLDDAQGVGATLKLVGPAPNSASRTFLFDDAMVMSGVTYSMKSKDPTAMAVTFACLYKDASSRNGIMGDA